MKEFRELLDKVFLVYYYVVDTSDECRSKRYYYADVVFKNHNSAQSYVREANETFAGRRNYRVVSVPII